MSLPCPLIWCLQDNFNSPILMIAPLADNEVATFLLPITNWDYSSLTQGQISNLLSPSEEARFRRFRPQSKKNEFIASRLLLRFLLRRYTACNTAQTEAIADEMGRPFWYENGIPLALFFSLSHTKNLICCALSRCRETGCDIESLERRKYQGDLTERVMSEEELRVYHQLPVDKQSDFFYRSWTLKEAYVKAVGQGMRIPFTSLSFTYEVLKRESFTVTPKQIAQEPETPPFSMLSKIPLPGYSLGLATSIIAPEISEHFVKLESGGIKFSL